eukprot:1254953-Alexandrium_andersonii.AAC.1
MAVDPFPWPSDDSEESEAEALPPPGPSLPPLSSPETEEFCSRPFRDLDALRELLHFMQFPPEGQSGPGGPPTPQGACPESPAAASHVFRLWRGA